MQIYAVTNTRANNNSNYITLWTSSDFSSSSKIHQHD